MPSSAPDTGDLRRMERSIGSSNNTSLHNKLANFVLDLQTDVTLEDLLESNDNNNNNAGHCSVQNTQNQHIPAERKEVHIRHLRHLYNEIKNQQTSFINGHEQPSKRRMAENTSTGFARNKSARSSENIMLHDTDCLDETWLMNFASQLGLDKTVDLPELNIDFMQELL